MRLFFALVIAALPALAANRPIQITHAGHLLDSEDKPVTNPQLSMTFRLLDRDNVSVDDVVVFAATCNVNVERGFYAVTLGVAPCAGDGLDAGDFPTGSGAGTARYLEVTVDSRALSPRMRVAPTPIANVALDAERLGGVAAADYQLKADAIAWDRLSGLPAGFADGTDDGNVYTAGAGVLISDENVVSLAPGGVGTAQLADASITLAKVKGAADVVEGALLSKGPNGAVGSAVLEGLSPITITEGKRIGLEPDALAITTAKIPDAAITTVKLAPDAVTAAKLAPDAVTAAKLAPDSASLLRITSNLLSISAGRLNVGGGLVLGSSLAPARLAVSGITTLGFEDVVCNDAVEGAQRYNKTGKRMEYCDGTNWKSFTTVDNRSCKTLRDAGTGANGTYTINPAGTPFTAYCDMVTDGGGWTLVGSWAALANYAMKNNTAGLTPSELANFPTSTPSGGPRHLSSANMNAIFNVGTKEYLVRNNNLLTRFKLKSGVSGFDAFKGIYWTQNNTDKLDAFTAAVATLPQASPSWTSRTTTGRACAETSNDCFHYLPDDLTGGNQWAFRENIDDIPPGDFSVIYMR